MASDDAYHWEAWQMATPNKRHVYTQRGVARALAVIDRSTKHKGRGPCWSAKVSAAVVEEGMTRTKSFHTLALAKRWVEAMVVEGALRHG